MIEFIDWRPNSPMIPVEASDPNVTHVIMGIGEYEDLMACCTAPQRINDILEAANDAASSSKTEETEAPNQMIAELTEELLREQRLNSTLLQMHKKDANVSRDLRPKKQHSGYVVQKSRQRDVRFRMGKAQVCARVFETVIQTPFSTQLPMDLAIQAAKELRMEGEWSIEKIGIQEIELGGYERFVKANQERDPREKNIAVDISWTANYSTRFWEATIQHTLPLTEVPAEMLAASKNEKDKE